MTRPVDFRHRYDTNAPAVRIFHGASRKDAKAAKFGEIGRYLSLRSWLSQRLIRPLADTGGVLAFRPVGPTAGRARYTLLKSFC